MWPGLRAVSGAAKIWKDGAAHRRGCRIGGLQSLRQQVPLPLSSVQKPPVQPALQTAMAVKL